MMHEKAYPPRPRTLRRAQVVAQKLHQPVPLARRVGRVERHRTVYHREVTFVVVERVVVRPEPLPVRRQRVRRRSVAHVMVPRHPPHRYARVQPARDSHQFRYLALVPHVVDHVAAYHSERRRYLVHLFYRRRVQARLVLEPGYLALRLAEHYPAPPPVRHLVGLQTAHVREHPELRIRHLYEMERHSACLRNSASTRI